MVSIFILDAGTSSMRGTLYSENGRTLWQQRMEYSPEYQEGGIVEQDPAIWSRCLIKICREAAGRSREQGWEWEGIGLTAQRTSVIPVDRQGKALSKAILWQDRRTSGICKEMEPYAGMVYERTGNRISNLSSAVKHTWLRRHAPDLFQAAEKLLSVADYLLFLLTGNFITDITYGSRTALMDLKGLCWDQELLRLFETDEKKLCELRRPGAVAGCVTEVFSQQTGVRQGIPVITAGGDQQCGAVGAGVLSPGQIQLTAGTGAFVLGAAGRICLDSRQGFQCNCSSLPGQYLLDASVLSASALYHRFIQECYGRPEEYYPRVNSSLAQVDPGAGGLIFLPYPQGRGAPDWNETAACSFLCLSQKTTKEEMGRAILEGIASEIAENAGRMEASLPLSFRISAAGGLTKCGIFNQILADFMDRRIYLPENRETTSFGCFAITAAALGLYSTAENAYQAGTRRRACFLYCPDPRRAEQYRRYQKRKQAVYRCLKESGAFERMSGEEARL